MTCDFLGWGASDNPQDYTSSFATQQDDLEAVINDLGLTKVAVVGHLAGVSAPIN